MLNGDISNTPAPTVAVNLGALVDIPKAPGFFKRVLNISPEPVPLQREAVWGIRRVSDLGYNIIVLCLQPQLYAFCRAQCDFVGLGTPFSTPDWDHYAALRVMYGFEAVLIVGEEHNLQSVEIMTYPDRKGWFALFDYLKTRSM